MSSLCAIVDRQTERRDQQDEDADLLTDFLEGDGTGLFQKYHQLILGYLRTYMEDEAAIDDIAQQVWQAVHMKGHTIRKSDALPSWLCVTAHNFMVNYLVRRRRSYFIKEESDSLAVPDGDPSSLLLLEERRGQVRRALKQLVPMDSAVLELFYLRGMSLKEVASQLSENENRMIPTGTVKRRLHVARKRFGEQFREIFSGPESQEAQADNRPKASSSHALT